jgi:hypothetical protein
VRRRCYLPVSVSIFY